MKSPTAATQNPWIRSPTFDLGFIFAPIFLPTLAVVVFRHYFSQDPPIPLWAWLALILGVDVAHVYSTLYRTYGSAEARRKHGSLLRTIPLLCWVVGVVLYSVSAKLFWSTLAYLAVFHFVRQQYGFLRIYSRQAAASRWEERIDAATIYLATLYPLVYWHAHLPRNFEWLISGDFFPGLPAIASSIVGAIYIAVLAVYGLKEIRRWQKTKAVNVPKQLLVAGTALSWYVGIVWLDGDLAFTLTNVLAHGIPYTALIWAYGAKRTPAQAPKFPWYRVAALPAFLGILWLLAYLEEGLWHGLLWRDKLGLFPGFQSLPDLKDAALLALIVPLLALPQATHYVLDGFIWRLRRGNSPLAKELWQEEKIAA